MSAVTFQYSAVDRAGARHTGATQAASRGEAYRKIAALGLTPVQIKALGETGGGLLGRGSRKARPKDIAHFTYQLGVLISARIPLSEGLLSIAAQEREGQLKDVITDIAHRVQAGEQIATALDNLDNLEKMVKGSFFGVGTGNIVGQEDFLSGDAWGGASSLFNGTANNVAGSVQMVQGDLINQVR
ncbi:MAG TPA: type II secretion system F family protein, partial [Phycisphaerales bacterium]|nr:type II secretion system F family protein [Phycisphaerales bacterium]